jgi:hypothetical protein
VDVGAFGHDKIFDLRLPIHDLKIASPNGGRLNTDLAWNESKKPCSNTALRGVGLGAQQIMQRDKAE